MIDPNGYEGREAAEASTGPTSEFVGGQYYVAKCENGSIRTFRYTPDQPTVSPEFLAQQATATITIAFPDPSTSPSIEHDHLVGLATWLWIDPGGFEAVTATAAPTQVVWDMGDDTEPIVYDDTATTTWEITWSATNGDGGTLPTIDRTTSFDLHVVERQAVVTG